MVAINKNDGTVIFGRQVKDKRQQLARDHYIFSSFKSRLGKDDEIEVAGRKYAPRDITALFLKGIKETLKRNMGLDLDNATFAIPVDFTPEQRRELKLAASVAGNSGEKDDRIFSLETVSGRLALEGSERASSPVL